MPDQSNEIRDSMKGLWWQACCERRRLIDGTQHEERVVNVKPTIAVLVFSITILHSQRASAAWGELKQPRLPMARTFTEAEYAKLNAVLDRKDVTFIKGYSLNVHSALQY